MSARLYPLRRTRPVKSERHLALDEHALMHCYTDYDFPSAFRVPPPPRLRKRSPVRWPFIVALVAAVLLWVLAR